MTPIPKPPFHIEPNHIGWHALRHRDGWWIGTDKGVTCYEDYDIARAANTIANERERDKDGRWRWTFEIKKFTGANKMTGEHTPPRSAEQAIRFLFSVAK